VIAMRLGLLAVVAGSVVALSQPQEGPRADHHQHLFGPAIVARSTTPMEVVDAARLIALLDNAGIRQAAVLSLAYMYGNPNRPPVEHEYEAVKAENDWTSAQVARFPDRLVAFCSVNPLRPYALEEIARCAGDPRLKRGLKLHFGNSDVNLADPADAARLRDVFALANRYRMAIVVHARTTISKQRPYGPAHARVFLETLLPAAPDVPVQIAHLAGSGGYDEDGVDGAVGVFVEAIAARDPRVAQLWFDVSGVAGLGNWPRPAARVAERIRQLGIRRVLWGADGATGGNTPAASWKSFTEVPLTPAELETIRTNVAPYLRDGA
jgi:predicted TIM-barrel fold metal-dependent hydrolase